METTTVTDLSRPAADDPPARRWQAGPVVREALLVVVGSIALAVVMTWPALPDAASTIPGGARDPLLVTWAFSWAGHAMLTDPGRIFDGNAFYPTPDSLAFSDSLAGYGPIAWFGSGSEAALVHYNLLYVLIAALSFVGGYALARQLGSGRLGALVAGAAFAFAPWRAAQAGHLHVVSTGGVALALAMLARGHGFRLRRRTPPDRPRPWWAIAGWLVAAWQVTIGFAVGLPFGYLLGAIVVSGAVIWLWSGRKRMRLPVRLLVADLTGLAVFAATVLAMSRPYLSVVERFPEARRGLDQVEKFSPPLKAFLAPPNTSLVWGRFSDEVRDMVGKSSEMRLLPGLVLILLAMLGLFVSQWPKRWRLGLAAFVALTVVLGMGTRFPGGGRYTDLVLWAHAPGWGAIRTPGRLVAFTTLALALLAAGAVGRLGYLARRSRLPRVAVLPLLLLPVLVVIEGAASIREYPVPAAPAAFRAAQGPMLVLPSEWTVESFVLYWSIDGFPQVANGFSGFTPPSVFETRRATKRFPDAESIAYLRQLGIRSVVVLRDRVPGTPWAGAADAEVGGLPVRREEIGGDVLYVIQPAR